MKKFFSAVIAALVLSVCGVTASADEATADTAGIEATDSMQEYETDNSSEIMDNDESISDGLQSYFIYDDSSFSDDSSTADGSENVLNEREYELIRELADGLIAEDSKPDYYGDPYYDTDGNASLITSENIVCNGEQMQFIAVTTKDGHVFYVLINYAAKEGEDSIYFLNKVDDFDLYALLYAGEDGEENEGITPEAAAQAAENARSRVNANIENDSSADSDDSENSDVISAESNQPANNNTMLVVGAVALIGIGAGAFILLKKKPKNKPAIEDESDEEDDIEFGDSDEAIFYDGDEKEI